MNGENISIKVVSIISEESRCNARSNIHTSLVSHCSLLFCGIPKIPSLVGGSSLLLSRCLHISLLVGDDGPFFVS